MSPFRKKENQEEASRHHERSRTKNNPEDDAAETGSQLEHKSPLTEEEEADLTFPEGLKLLFLIGSIFVGMFLVALDRLIISTAIPQITDEFHSANDIGWYATAYLLTSCSFQLLFGKIYAYFNIKYTFLLSVLLFEVGSALCGAAPNSVAFIIGRAVAGLGSGGVQAGCLVVIVYAVPLHKRPAYQGLFGAVFGIASVAGPLIGGAFTTNITWRWCFYVNLPIGGVVMVMIWFLLDVPDRPSIHMPLKDKLAQLNAYGLVVLVPAVVCLGLALQWGGTACSWGNPRIIVLLILAILLFVAFALIQVWKPEQATTPPHIFMQRSIWSGFLVSVCLGAHLNVFVYYLPIWFQAIDDVSAVASGIHLLPLLLSLVLGSMFAGLGITKVGYYTPFLLIGTAITAVGAGLLTTFNVDTTEGQWIGYQMVYGFGFGASSQVPNMAAQTVLKRDEVPIGATLMFFGLQLAGAIFTSVGENVLDNQLVNSFKEILSINPTDISNAGVTNVLKLVPPKLQPQARVAYNDSVRQVFRVGLIVACISILGAAAMEWVSVKKEIKKQPADEAGEDEKGVALLSGSGSTDVGGVKEPRPRPDLAEAEAEKANPV